MPTDTVQLLGAGGHARVVIDALLCCGWPVQRITPRDDRAELAGTLMLGCRIETPVLGQLPPHGQVHAAIGDNAARQRLLEASGIAADLWLVVCHPAAVLAASARIGAGSFFAAQSVTGPNASIGRSVIVNHGAVVDHDCQVGHFSHIAPRASLGGGARVGQGVLVGAGAVILPGVTIGDRAVVGAGAVVLADVAPGITVTGVPARPTNKGIA
ncbi:MAG: acetyltransferase [Rhodoferax sp.]|nr:acetyltransferase [Rhodoferax sp.]